MPNTIDLGGQMRLDKLVGNDAVTNDIMANYNIKGLTADSREVKKGYLFAALQGSTKNGNTYISEAISRGASAILTSEKKYNVAKGVCLISSENPRKLLSHIASRYYKAQPKIIVAVTGTNGKTSVTQFTHQIWQAANFNGATLGTMGISLQSIKMASKLTTPDPISLHRTLAALSKKKINYLAMEASSHGLVQHRLDFVNISAAAYTNLSRDHLDYHKNMSAYLNAKMHLFSKVLIKGGDVIANSDSPEFPLISQICKKQGHSIIDYGRNANRIRLESSKPIENGQQLKLIIDGRSNVIRIPLIGHIQTMNALCASGLAISSGIEVDTLLTALESLQPIPGRLEHIGQTQKGASVYIDFAHTPESLMAILCELRTYTARKLVVVFGAGGDRDKGKRRLMGEAAQKYADTVYVTDDNPRSEEPSQIRQEVIEGCPNAINIEDRKNAITQAIKTLESGDLVLIAGKGDETNQIFGDTVIPFSDREICINILSKSQ